MNKESIKKELINLVSTLFLNSGFDADMLEYADLIDDLGMDSITFISLIVEIESLFNVEVPDDLLLMDNFKTVDDAVRIVAKMINEKTKEKEEVYNDQT